MWFTKPRPSVSQEDCIERYAREELPSRLGLAPAAERRITVSGFARGSVALVRRVDVEGYGTVVLRLYPRKNHLPKLQGYRQLHALLAAHELPVPRMLFADDSRSTCRAYGFWALAEEFVDARSVVELPPADRVRPLMHLGDVLARLHAIRSPQVGMPWEGWRGRRRFTTRWARREGARWVQRIEAAGLGLSRARGRAFAAWFPEQFRSLAREEYPLVHGDPNGHNLLVTRDGTLYLLDFGRAAHWFPQFDLVIAEHWVEELAPGHAAEFLDRYFRGAAGSPALSRLDYERTRALFFAWFYLDCAAGIVRRVARRAGGGARAEDTLQEARRFWALSERFLAEAGGP
jgi:hypothetical protein